ncbi:TetR/AcrR family transcriptional regulator [Aneurinibacillus tyrosinisolvens]|uniref:TetR/AcrR family transcriptional regulator n=1 Tax=Aneurinibacillus tyrosinisolvens TaxID=1443435 RepID=UPI0006995941|nr:TetR/AcrR family transcriptional regulator [Aneurinibacillus tyrosinisolvens]
MIESFSKNPSFQLLLAATEQLIKEKGCRSTTLQDIIERTGLSKGAIYHYVSGKDELFGLILQAKVEEMNHQFQASVTEAVGGDAPANPFQVIATGLLENNSGNNVSNTIFIYLLSQKDNPKIEKILSELYEFSYQTAVAWIEIGQQRGAIPASINAKKMGSMFMVFSYGMRVQNVVAPSAGGLGSEDVFRIIFHSLTDPNSSSSQ